MEGELIEVAQEKSGIYYFLAMYERGKHLSKNRVVNADADFVETEQTYVLIASFIITLFQTTVFVLSI